ncbi:MAG: hypothetical protein NXI11_04045 [Proteobacteria bacterium]|nr:hypothetical protein [Pseudomonadota bacterium]
MATKKFYHDIDGQRLAQIIGFRLEGVADQAAEDVIAGSLDGTNAGMPVYRDDLEQIRYWTGTAFKSLALETVGDIAFKGGIADPTNADADVELVSGYQYVIEAAGELSITGVTISGDATVKPGDMVILFDSTDDGTADTAYVVQRNVDEATESTAGTVRLATQSEANAGTNDSAAVTPLKLQSKLDGQNYTRSYTETVTTTAATPLTITHNLGLPNKDAFTVNVMDSNGSQVSVDVDSVDANSITITTLLGQTDLVVTVSGAAA